MECGVGGMFCKRGVGAVVARSIRHGAVVVACGRTFAGSSGRYTRWRMMTSGAIEVTLHKKMKHM
jgi:hypothetical protein